MEIREGSKRDDAFPSGAWSLCRKHSWGSDTCCWEASSSFIVRVNLGGLGRNEKEQLKWSGSNEAKRGVGEMAH